jgi:uncharacterized protein (TIRG00374 family)
MKFMSRRLMAIARTMLGVGLIYYILFVRDNGFDSSEFLNTGWLFVVLPLLALIGGAVESLRLGLLCRSQSAHLGFWHGLRLVLISVFFNFFIPGGTGGDVAKMYYLAADNPGKGVELATVVFVDRVTGLLGLIITVMGLALMNAHIIAEYSVIKMLVQVLVTVLFVTFIIALIIYSGWFQKKRLYKSMRRRLPLQHFVDRIAAAVDAFWVHKLALFAAIVVSVLGNGVMIGMFLFAGVVFMPDVSGMTICFLSVLGMFANALPITPGGLGVGEAAFDGLFGLLGLSGGAMLIIAWRLGMLPLGLAGGVIYLLGAGRKSGLDPQYGAQSGDDIA